MTRVSVHEARRTFSALLERVAAGEEVVITRYGKVVARLTPERGTAPALPDLAAFRESIRVEEGKSLDDTVQKLRDEHRF